MDREWSQPSPAARGCEPHYVSGHLNFMFLMPPYSDSMRALVSFVVSTPTKTYKVEVCFLSVGDVATYVYQEVGKWFCSHLCDMQVHITFYQDIAFKSVLAKSMCVY